MDNGSVQACNICLKSSEKEPKAVFIKAVSAGEEIHVCTACIPQIIHGDANVVKTNDEVQKLLG